MAVTTTPSNSQSPVLGNCRVLSPCLAGELPAAAAGNVGWRGMVTDSNATLTAGIGAVVATGGANIVPVVSDGTNWLIGG